MDPFTPSDSPYGAASSSSYGTPYGAPSSSYGTPYGAPSSSPAEAAAASALVKSVLGLQSAAYGAVPPKK
jgi:hypothetical protein